MVKVPATHLVRQLRVGRGGTQVVDDAREAVPDRNVQRRLSVLHQHNTHTRNEGRGVKGRGRRGVEHGIRAAADTSSVYGAMRRKGWMRGWVTI